jgi:hypothetical protein
MTIERGYGNRQKSQPEYVRAARISRRECIRLWITMAVFLAILIEAGVAVYIARDRQDLELGSRQGLAYHLLGAHSSQQRSSRQRSGCQGKPSR